MITTFDSPVDPSGRATALAAEGRIALMKGNTREAAARFAEAGKELESHIRSKWKSADKHMIRYLAATQFFLGGHYSEALRLCRRIQRDMLPDHLHEGFSRFCRDVQDRARPDHAPGIRQKLLQYWQTHEFGQIIALLQNHPFVLDEGSLAFIRAICCEHLEQLDAAAVFFADAIEKQSNQIQFPLIATAGPLIFLDQGKLNQAWMYAEQLLAKIHHPAAAIAASTVRFCQAIRAATQEERQRMFEDLVRFVDMAIKLFDNLPEQDRSHSEIRKYVAFGLEGGLVASYNLKSFDKNADYLGILKMLSPHRAQLYEDLPLPPEQEIFSQMANFVHSRDGAEEAQISQLSAA